MDPVAKTGISLAALRELAGRVDAAVGKGATTATVVDQFIRPATIFNTCSYIELLPNEDRGVPNMVIIAPWTLSFSNLVDALTQSQPPSVVDPVYLWLDLLACNLHRAGAVRAGPSGASPETSPTGTEAAAPHGLPNSALETYRHAIHAIATTSPCSDSSSSQGKAAAPVAALVVVLDTDATVLTSPWCLYGIWTYMHYRRAAVAAGHPIAIAPLCVGSLDLLLVHLAWESLSLLLPSPHLSDALHASIVEEVTAEEPITLPPGTAAEAAATAAGASKRAAGQQADGSADASGGGSGGRDEERPEPDVEARVAAADAAIKHGLLTAFEQRIDSMTAVVDAAQATAVQQPAEQQDPAANTTAKTDSGPLPLAPGPSTTPSMDLVQMLAVTSDAYGCLLWAAGRPAEGEPHLRRARNLHATLRQPLPHPFPLLLPLPLLHLHLGALLHVLPLSLEGDEAELLLRNAIEQLDADANADADADAHCAHGAAALQAAQGRHFLARLLCLRAANGDANDIATTTTVSAKADAGKGSRTVSGAAIVELEPSGGGICTSPAAAEVAPLLRAALPVFEAHYGGEHLLTAVARTNLAMVLKHHGAMEEVEALLRRSLAAREVCQGSSHVDTMRCMNNLAGLLEEQGNLEEAEALLRRVAETAASSLGPAHAHTANALSNLGVALRKAGKLDEAEELFKAALDIREQLLGPLALDTAASLGDMTMLMLDQGRLAEAEPLFRRILDIRELVLGSDHRDTAASLCDLAALLSQMDRHVDAEPLLRRAVSVQTRCLGPGHEDTAAATMELGKVLAQRGQAEEAERLLRRAQAIMESVLGVNHPQTVTTVNQLAVLLKEAGQNAKAETLFRRVLSVTDSLDLDLDSTTVTAAATTATAATSPSARATRRRFRAAALIAMRGLAELAAAGGRLEEAEVLSCRALVASERVLGAVHPVTLACAEGLGEVLQQMGLLEDAAELYARLVETLAEEYSTDSEHVVKYLELYEAVYVQAQERERQQQAEERPQQQQAEETAQEDDKDEQEEEEEEEEEEDVAESEAAGAAPPAARHVRVVNVAAAAAARGGRTAEGVGSIMTTLLGPMGRSMTVKRRAMAAQRQQSRRSEASAASGAGDGGGSGGGEEQGSSGRRGLRHSFASFVSRRNPNSNANPNQQQQQNPGQSRGPAIRTKSVVERVRTSLVAAGRIDSGGPLGDARKNRQGAPAAAAAVSHAAAAANGANSDEGVISPGLPRIGQEDDAAGGAATVSLDAPRQSGSGGGAGGDRGPRKAGSQDPQLGEEVYDPMTVPLITASAFGYGSVTSAGGSSDTRPISARPLGPGAARRSSGGPPRSMTMSMIAQRGVSKKALLQQADMDLEDSLNYDASDTARQPPPPLPGAAGRASRRVSGAVTARAVADDNDYEDTASVGCCGFGGGGPKRRVRPVT